MIRTCPTVGLLLALACPLFAQQAQDVAAARDKAIAFLKAQQKNGTWEDAAPSLGQNRGGMTALAALALLESGVKAEDPAVKAALAYLRDLPQTHTYTVSLKTLCFCKADPKGFAEEIQKQADWLVAKARSGRNVLVAWGYPTEGFDLPPGTDTDLSNSHYAVEALAAAAQAGAKVDLSLWSKVQKTLIDNQLQSGGWSYQFQVIGLGAGERQTMTAGAIASLALAQRQLPQKDPAADLAIQKGLRRLGIAGRIVPRAKDDRSINYRFYHLAVLGKALAATGTKELVDRGNVKVDWRAEGTRWLLQNQNSDGSWSAENVDGVPIIATSLALRFLAK